MSKNARRYHERDRHRSHHSKPERPTDKKMRAKNRRVTQRAIRAGLI